MVEQHLAEFVSPKDVRRDRRSKEESSKVAGCSGRPPNGLKGYAH